VRNFRHSWALLTLFACGAAALGQASMNIVTGKPEKPVLGIPFSADQSVRTVQVLANGTTLIHQTSGHVYRSAEGVERIEGSFPSTDPAQPADTVLVFLVDRAKLTATTLNSKLKTATVTHLPENSTVTVKFLALESPIVQNRQVKPDTVETTDLGKRTQGLVSLVGKRVTGTIPAGKIGNPEAITMTTDVWIAPDLKLIVSEVEKNPLVGERTFDLTNIRSEEPEPSLFLVPDGYTVKERPTVMPPLPSLGTAPKSTSEQRTPQIEDALSGSDPKIKNGVAYGLANNGDHLADAQTLAEQAVQSEEQTAAEVVPGGGAKAFAETSLLASFWDTLGWVYCRQGKQEKAEAYLLAAWELKPNPETGYHLGRVYEAELRPKEAIKFYKMSLSGKNPPARQDFFQTQLAKLGEQDAQPLPLEMTTPLPFFDAPPQADDRIAVVDILISDGQPPTVSVLQGDPKLQQSISRAIQAALAKDLPDQGPEKVLRRARLSCNVDATHGCMLRFLSSEEAKTANLSPTKPAS
jgi:hypothetical protein